MSPGTPLTTNQHWFRYWLGVVLVKSQCLNKCWHSSLDLNEFSFIPLYHNTVCRCVFVCISHNVYERDSCFRFYMYATLIFFLLNIYCYVSISLLLLVCTIYVFTTSLYMCVINHYVFIDLYIESRGLATILVLMLLVLQCTDYK